jgi:Flp pilus assembly pilin Flp
MLMRIKLLVGDLFASARSVALTGQVPNRGQGLAEYALILALIAIVAIIALLFLGGQVSKILSTVGKSI